jgi:hypothetical protein
MRSALNLFLVSLKTPLASPTPGPEFEVEAKTEDYLLQAGRDLLVSKGYRICALMFGVKGLLAYVEKAE